MLRSPILHFLLAGGLLFVLQNAWSSVPETPRVEVRRSEINERLEAYRRQMGRDATEEEARAIESQVVENAIWLEQAFALGLHEIDSVVHQRLILNMKFLDGETEATDEELVTRAFELGMDRSDTVVQRRLVDRVQAIIRGGVRARPLEEETLAAHFAETAERWREPPLLELTHVYLSRDKRREATEVDAAKLLERIRREALDPDAGVAEGDPFLAGHRLRGATPNRIIARLGPTFAEGVSDASPKEWFGPIESAFGYHLVWIHAKTESRIPELAEVRSRVVEDWIEQESRKALREFVSRQRKVVEVRVIEDVGEAAASAEIETQRDS